MDLHDLPVLNACLNALCAVFLILGFRFIRTGRRTAHRNCMLAAVGTSVLFLASYLTYHFVVMKGEPTPLRTEGWFRSLYFAILISHTILAVAIVPLVIVTLNRALRGRFPAHRKIARRTWPLWIYVSVTGVCIYFFLYHLDPALTR